MALSSTQEIIEDIRQGKMVILMDDEDRENEGDLIMAAEHVRPEDINFMAKYGRGLICLTLTDARCRQLNIPQMVSHNTEQYSTAFTVSIEAAEGVTTGISAADRARTVQAAVAKDAKPSDLVQPGHIFPLKAQNGGVLTRAGHTEAGCDLARLAGLEPSSVIVEILNEDGTMARRPDLEVFAKEHDIKLGTIADLIEYRNQNETTIEQLAQCHWPTDFGTFELVTFRDTIDDQVHFALKKGEIKATEPTLVRVHLYDTLADELMGQRPFPRIWTLEQSMIRIASEGGLLVLVSKNDTSRSLLRRLRMFEAIDKGEHPELVKKYGPSRDVGIGSQILRAMGVGKMRLMSTPKHYHALSGFGLEIVSYVTD
ncbi:bifunctional 3,4-dihydroxy-2-butanone-4-phosphate synthase/GTP cyclohydrolase II [Zobellella maritima]|uniref:bifunctional 3,4-dihydroxy-2-butanone-4-phosphate synthase/GTP cyclohydrolase II n=1 Tax=Zobellella maritima TaxID=2059725 RepID=UPI000E3079B1|nr:bifunctional 3,4-dihydroxy-2-butanone-4-phosphate synthase/GTP cyclohydrolase II [Zobellella maritima]